MRGYLQRLYDRATALAAAPGLADLRPALASSSPIAEADRRLDDPDLAATDLPGFAPAPPLGETPMPASAPAPTAVPGPAAALPPSYALGEPQVAAIIFAAPPQPAPEGPMAFDPPPAPGLSESRRSDEPAVPNAATQVEALRREITIIEESAASLPPLRREGNEAEAVAREPPERPGRVFPAGQPATAAETLRPAVPLMQPAAPRAAPSAEPLTRAAEPPSVLASAPAAAERRPVPPAPPPTDTPAAAALPARPLTAATASRIGPLAPRRRAHLVFGLRRR